VRSISFCWLVFIIRISFLLLFVDAINIIINHSVIRLIVIVIRGFVFWLFRYLMRWLGFRSHLWLDNRCRCWRWSRFRNDWLNLRPNWMNNNIFRVYRCHFRPNWVNHDVFRVYRRHFRPNWMNHYIFRPAAWNSNWLDLWTYWMNHNI